MGSGRQVRDQSPGSRIPRLRREAATAGLAVARADCAASGGGRSYLPTRSAVTRRSVPCAPDIVTSIA
jgi:hypothetical protein